MIPPEYTALVDDAAIFPPGNAPLEEAVPAHREHRAAPYGDLVGPFVVQRLGEKRAREGAYAWRKLIEAGAVVTNGTDAPVEDLNPLGSFYASVTRRMIS